MTKSEWTRADEDGYSTFVQRIGESGCDTPNACLNSDANRLRGGDSDVVNFNADCADLAYLLRAYYAWKNGLPFSYATGITSRGAGDVRFSAAGNRVTGRRDIATSINAKEVLNNIRNTVSSAMMRIGPGTDGSPLSDFYPVKIQRGSVRPGTVIYDVNGHVAIVYRIGDDGRIYYMDAHPDFTLSRSVYGAQFSRDIPAMGAGFKNFRPLQVRDGRVSIAGNAQIADYSTEQYFGNVTASSSTDWRQARFQFGGTDAGFYEYVRLAMAKGRLTFDPVDELSATIKTLCNDLFDRQRYVELSVQKGIDRKDHPARLPSNIYGADVAEWETYSTPSRDARLKAAFVGLRHDMLRLIDLWNAGDARIAYVGLDLQGDLRRAYDRAAQLCTVIYRNSGGREITLRLPEISQRLFAMSFDPYDCIERRWGAVSPAELATCANTPAKNRWYVAQQALRNQIERDYDQRTDFTVQQLEAGGPGTGAAVAPDINVLGAIAKARVRPVMEDGPASGAANGSGRR